MPKHNQHDKQFKLDAIRYVKEHSGLTQKECCKNLGVGLSTLQRCLTLYRNNNGEVPCRGSGNFASDKQNEIARLKKNLQNTQDSLEILKKLSAFWEKAEHHCLHRNYRYDRNIHNKKTPLLYHQSAENLRLIPLGFPCFPSS